MYFLFWLWFGKRWLLDDFNSEDFLCLLGYEFVASGESTFSEEVSFEVGGDFVVIEIVVLDDFEILVGWIWKKRYDRVGVGS